jgi:hypothetical protein
MNGSSVPKSSLPTPGVGRFVNCVGLKQPLAAARYLCPGTVGRVSGGDVHTGPSPGARSFRTAPGLSYDRAVRQQRPAYGQSARHWKRRRRSMTRGFFSL